MKAFAMLSIMLLLAGPLVAGESQDLSVDKARSQTIPIRPCFERENKSKIFVWCTTRYMMRAMMRPQFVLAYPCCGSRFRIRDAGAGPRVHGSSFAINEKKLAVRRYQGTSRLVTGSAVSWLTQ
jgi:hypothetical protein